MCGRIVVSRYGADLSQMRNYANQIMKNLASFRASYNIAPGGYVPGVYKQSKTNDKDKDKETMNQNSKSDIILESMKWGIDTGRIDTLLFNSRSDTINIYPFYKKYKRCIIIIEGYYEWKKINKGGNKTIRQPYYISLKEKDKDGLIYLAGLYSEEIDEDGFKYKSASIITCNANKQIELIHDRMPLIFKNFDEAEKYLNGDNLNKFINATQNLEMNFYEVGDLVNNFKNNTKDNILPKDKVKYNKNGNLLINNFLNKSKSEISMSALGKKDYIENKKKELKINQVEEINKRANSSHKIEIKENETYSEVSTITGLTNGDNSENKNKNKKLNFLFSGKIKPKHIKDNKKASKKSKNISTEKSKNKNKNKQVDFMKNFLTLDK
jgi:putative SOS response-associated peptidase YedK